MPPIPPPSSTRATASRILPFGLPQLHVGTDICHVSRVYSILKKARPASSTTTTTTSPPSQTTAARFIRRVLTPREVEALSLPSAAASTAPSTSTTLSAHAAVALLAKGTPLPEDNASLEMSPLWRAAQFLAGRFAAKEAAIKAHPHLPGLTLQDVRIARRAATTVKTDDTADAKTDAKTDNGLEDDVVQRRNANSGPPLAYVRVYALETDTDGNDSGIVEQEARISISHDGEYATAVCLGIEHT